MKGTEFLTNLLNKQPVFDYQRVIIKKISWLSDRINQQVMIIS